MRVGDHAVEWQGESVVVSGPGRLAASGRWSGGKIVERAGTLVELGDDTAEWEAIEIALRRAADEFVDSSFTAAYDARGVDVTQIDRMLDLSPQERLQVLDDQRRSILSLLGNAPHD